MYKLISTRLFSLLLMCFMVAGICGAAPSGRNVTVNVENSTLKSLFKAIESQTTYRFSYRMELIDGQKGVTVKMTDVPVGKVLDAAFSGRDLSYEIVSPNSIVITKKVDSGSPSSASGNKKTISGVVLDNLGDPAIGATVMVKGTNNGCSTDIDGRYTLGNVPADATIVFSMIGCVPREIAASDARALTSVEMKENAEVLDEVVVVGYGTQKRANLTGAVATISADDINNRPVANAANALQGADPSVNLTFNSGSMDAGYKIDIRGAASINRGSPLVLCDGMEVSLGQINPNDIESISVLKDASAAAIYGAKASSGVILITTKSGKDSDGKVNVSYNGRFGWRKNTTSTDFIHTGYDHVTIVNKFYRIAQGKDMWGYTGEDLDMLEARRYDNTENPDRPWTIERDGKLYFYANYDWYDYFYRDTRPEQEHNVSITGGNAKTNYYVSGRFLQQDGIFKIYNDKYTNYSFRMKLNAELFPFLRYSGGANFNYTNYKYAGYWKEQQTIHALQSNINSAVMPLSPDGQTIQYVNTMTGANSPLGAGHAGYLTDNQSRNSRGNKDFVLTNQFDIDIYKDLVITASYAYRYRNRGIERRGVPFNYLDKSGSVKKFTSGTVEDFYQEIKSDINRHSVNVFGTYNHVWNRMHNFKAVAGMQYEHQRNTELSVKKSDLLSDDLSSMSVANGVATVTEEISAYKTLGYFARLNYDYDGKYLLEVSGRYDGSSRFAPGCRWGFFPSASAGWRMSQEKFWDGMQGWWNNSKLRVSYGSLGNQQVSNYAYFDKIYTDKILTDYTFDGEQRATYATVSSPLSSNLTWEKVITYNLGLDFGFLNNRLTATADIFVRDTKDMLTHSVTLPSVFGATTPKQNCADLRTRGWELYLRWNDNLRLFGHRLNYSISATFGDYKSKITKFNNPDKLISDYYEGMTLGEIWGYKVDGLFASDEEAAEYQSRINDKAVNQRVYNAKTAGDNKLRAGDVKFIDLDGNGKIDEGSGVVGNSGDKRIIGNSIPRYNYSFRLDLNYVGFDVSAFFQGVGKCDWMPVQNSYDFWGPYDFPSLSFIHKDFLSMCWSEDTPDGYFPRQRGYQTYDGGSLSVATDRYLQNAAYLRLKNLTVGYTLPIKKNRWINSVRVYFTGENLAYWSPLKKHTKTVDPEMATSSGTYKSNSGTGYGFSKSFSLGVDVKF